MPDRDDRDKRLPSSPAEAGRVDFPTYKRGPWWPAYVLLILPFVFLTKKLLPLIKEEINWRAAIVTIVAFEVFMLFAEHYNLKRGHWVYNEARILGPRVFGIPIEEPFIYYWFPPFLAIVMMLAFKRELDRRGKP